MTDQKDAKLQELIRELAAEYFQRESNGQSLITVTGIETWGRGSKARILITVLPESQEETALGFIHRQLTDFRGYVMERARLMRVPHFEVALDKGEKNRQHIDEIERTI
jgi:ribosome-binding factor A